MKDTKSTKFSAHVVSEVKPLYFERAFGAGFTPKADMSQVFFVFLRVLRGKKR